MVRPTGNLEYWRYVYRAKYTGDGDPLAAAQRVLGRFGAITRDSIRLDESQSVLTFNTYPKQTLDTSDLERALREAGFDADFSGQEWIR